ncbi:helix-turn-helix domain containing protein [Ornithinimicrobium sufpigmenti]|uniref:helix-turn-helix domain containing protein n=1 Tax=Ornithinimicrobium sufpigmenti TaxID=2508882 RepID=UPI00103584E8|nr:MULTISPECIES: helix-turn-helix domain containing protein [unclassified Ornithinimicrobium]
MATHATATCTDCGFTGTYETQPQADYALRRHSCDRQRMLQAREARVAARKAASGPTRDCTCPIARHQHGTHAAYVIDRCRCRPCRDATAAYERNRAKQRAYGRQAYVPAGHARTHVLHLMSQGMGWKRVAAAAGIDTSVVWKLLYGDPSRNQAPTKRVMPKTADALLAVTLDLAPGAKVDSTGTTRRLQALVAMGWSQSQLATRLGMLPSNLTPIAHGRRGVTKATADAVTALYDELWSTPAPPSGRHGAVPTKTRNYAARMGWVGPLAWDDDTIDDPEARPNTGTDEPIKGGHRVRLHVEDVEWLLDQEDHTWDGIAHRLGVRRATVERALYRAGRDDLVARLTTNTRGIAA